MGRSLITCWREAQLGHIKQIQAGCAACKSLTFSESVKSACVRGGIQNATQLLKCFLGKQKGGARNNLNGKPNLIVFMSMLQRQVNAVLTRQGLVVSETECHLAWGLPAHTEVYPIAQPLSSSCPPDSVWMSQQNIGSHFFQGRGLGQ